LKDWTRAVEDAKECVRLDPTFLKGYYRLALAQVELKDYTAALATIRQGLSMEATHPQLLKLLRTVQQQQQRSSASNNSLASTGGPTSRVLLDDATRKEFEDLQVEHTRAAREHGAVQGQLQSAQRQAKMAELTRKELEDVSDDTKCYRSVGKAFLRSWSNKSQVIEHLDKQVSDFAKQESDLVQKTEYLERRIKSQRQNMEELISSSSATAAG
jgi:prefoldin subunit 1